MLLPPCHTQGGTWAECATHCCHLHVQNTTPLSPRDHPKSHIPPPLHREKYPRPPEKMSISKHSAGLGCWGSFGEAEGLKIIPAPLQQVLQGVWFGFFTCQACWRAWISCCNSAILSLPISTDSATFLFSSSFSLRALRRWERCFRR